MNSNEMQAYQLWREKATADPDLQAELTAIENDPDGIQDRFYRDLAFGTGGLRGVIGAGSNRMNVYTIRRATQGLANYLCKAFDRPSVAIAHDSRIKSDLFADTAAEVLAANGIHVYMYPELAPTPMLSFAVRALHCSGGIVITASHNPAKYNGYKAYGADGCQMTLDAAARVMNEIEAIPVFDGAKHQPLQTAIDAGMISYIGNEVYEDYYKNVLAQGIHTGLCAASGLKVVYTPLNGTGNRPVRHILQTIGIQDVTVVPEQENPDGNFTTCPFPNPEIREALALGLKLCEQVRPDLLLATDPDADRVGIAVPDGDGYTLITGNEMGAMLFEYICAERTANHTMPERPVVVKTIVTTDLIRAIAANYGVEVFEVLTGFKFIGEQITFLEQKGEEKRYVFGFEESYGYLAGTYVRDKDSIVASMLIVEMAAYYRTKGISMIQARDNLYKKYGVYRHTQQSFQFEGESGMRKMQEIMNSLRANPPKTIGGLTVTQLADYENSITTNFADGTTRPLTLPQSNVLAFTLTDGASVVIRPSGTEPKIKAYYTATGSEEAAAIATEAALMSDFSALLK